MLRLIFLISLCGCATIHNSQPSDTKLDESKKNWIEIYQNEINIAIENEDAEAYHFFMQELTKEKNKFLLEQLKIWNNTN